MRPSWGGGIAEGAEGADGGRVAARAARAFWIRARAASAGEAADSRCANTGAGIEASRKAVINSQMQIALDKVDKAL